MRLLMVELARLRARRMIALLLLAAAALTIVVAGAVAFHTRPLTERDRVEASAQAELESQRPDLQAEVRACESDPANYVGSSAVRSDCADVLIPSAETYYPREELSLGRTLRSVGPHLALVVVGLLVIAGSIFAGADWSTRSITNQLTFEPRRTRVWLAKAAAVAITAAAVTAVMLGGFWLAMHLMAEARGLDVSSAATQRIVGHVARATILAAAAAVGAFALTMVFRHTVATLALLFVYAAGGEIAVNLLPFEGAGRWSVGNNVYGWLSSNHRYFDGTVECLPGERCAPMQVMTHLEAGTFLGALLVVAVVVSLGWFRRADV